MSSSTFDLEELLPLHALGILEGDEAEAVEQAIEANPTLAAQLVALREGTHALLSSFVMPINPPVDLEKRLMASVGAGPFERFAKRFAEIFDLAVDRTRELLGLCERESSWGEEAPGIFLIHFAAGPSVVNADCGIVRMKPAWIPAIAGVILASGLMRNAVSPMFTSKKSLDSMFSSAA